MSSKTNFFQRNEGATDAQYNEFATSVGHKIDTSHKNQQLLQFAIRFIPPTIIPDFFEPYEADELMRTTSEHPLELARIYLNLVSEDLADYSKEGVISDHLRPFPKSDFERWGDVNWLPDVAKAWFHAEGVNLDVQAMEMSDYYNGEITEADLVDYVRQWKPGKYRTIYKRQQDELEDRWTDLFGFKLSRRYAENLTGLIKTVTAEEIVVPF